MLNDHSLLLTRSPVLLTSVPVRAEIALTQIAENRNEPASPCVARP